MPGEVFNIADDQPVPPGTMLQTFAEALRVPHAQDTAAQRPASR
jgi:hypothetical protein